MQLLFKSILWYFIFVNLFSNFYIMKVTSTKLYHLYLALVSFVSVVAIAITLWVVLTALWKFLIISDEEYIQHSRSWEIMQCEEPKLTTGRDERIERTQEEIEECKIKATDSAIKARRYNLKDMFISSWAWMIVFVIVFLFHYPKFLKSRD